MLIVSFFDIFVLKNNPYLILSFYFLCLILLGGLFFVPEIRGIKGWYKIGPLAFDPIEITKLVLVVLLAKYFSMRHAEMYRLRHIILSGFYVFLPVGLIFLQPDLGSVLILVFLWVVILIISGIKLSHFLILCLIMLMIGVLAWLFLLEDYQKQRISAFLNPRIEPLGIGWSQRQSKIAIGSGGIFGRGIGRGSQTQYGFLPEAQTDFIFASLAEETGLVGVSILFLLYSILIWRIIKIALCSRTNFSRFFASGLTAVMISQVFIHIGMSLGLLPIIGISLPLVSYGGSGLISLFIGLGMLQNIKVRT